MWNLLPKETRTKDSYTDFLEEMYKRYNIHQYKIVNLFKYDTEVDNIYLKLRFQCSALRADQYKFNFVNDPKCNQCIKNKQETIHHYFMDCTKYNIQRQKLKYNISTLHQTYHNITNRQLVSLIQGKRDDNIDINIYRNIYQYVKLFIVTTGRFA